MWEEGEKETKEKIGEVELNEEKRKIKEEIAGEDKVKREKVKINNENEWLKNIFNNWLIGKINKNW